MLVDSTLVQLKLFVGFSPLDDEGKKMIIQLPGAQQRSVLIQRSTYGNLASLVPQGVFFSVTS
jgi:hypothetical protein